MEPRTIAEFCGRLEDICLDLKAEITADEHGNLILKPLKTPKKPVVCCKLLLFNTLDAITRPM